MKFLFLSLLLLISFSVFSKETVIEEVPLVVNAQSFTCHRVSYGKTNLADFRSYCEDQFKKVYGGTPKDQYGRKDQSLGKVINVYRGKQYETGDAWVTYEVISK